MNRKLLYIAPINLAGSSIEVVVILQYCLNSPMAHIPQGEGRHCVSVLTCINSNPSESMK